MSAPGTHEYPWKIRPVLGIPSMSEHDLLGAALLHPGFVPASENIAWRLTINKEGMVRQELKVIKYQESDVQTTRVEGWALSRAEVEEIFAIAERIGFREFADTYDDPSPDHETMWIAMKFADELKAVYAYAPTWVAGRDGRMAMLGFVELWSCIHKRAPWRSSFNRPEELVATTARLWSRLR